MTLADVTRDGVLAAVHEFDRLGRDAFLKSTGFGRSKAYYLDHGKPLRLETDRRLRARRQHWNSMGPLEGDTTVAHRLKGLGFTVAFLSNPDWTRDEIILACDLVQSNGWRQLNASDERVRFLSDLLQSRAIHRGRRNPDFRNPAGVALKTYNIVADRSNGNQLDKLVRQEFQAHPAEMRSLADRIRGLLHEGLGEEPAIDDPDLDELSILEGGVTLREHLRRERSPKLRRQKLAEAKRRGVAIACEVCGFDFQRVYGERGRDYIECHHRTPLHVSGETDTRLSDLALICSNCHRMAHRGSPWLTVEQLKVLVAASAPA